MASAEVAGGGEEGCACSVMALDGDIVGVDSPPSPRPEPRIASAFRRQRPRGRDCRRVCGV